MIIKTMKLADVPPAGIQYEARLKRRIVKDTVQNFTRCSARCIEIIDDEGLWANSNNFRRSFQNYLDINCIESVIVTIRGNRVFLIKEKRRHK